MDQDALYQLLAARFCHDLASPINAAGLLLEMGSDDETQMLAKKNQAKLTCILRFYRILFAYRVDEGLLDRVLEVIQEACLSQGVKISLGEKGLSENSEKGLSSGLLKALIALFYILMPWLQESDYLVLTNDEDALDAVEKEILPKAYLDSLAQNGVHCFPEGSGEAYGLFPRASPQLLLTVKTQNSLSDLCSAGLNVSKQMERSSQNIFPFFLGAMLQGAHGFLTRHGMQDERGSRMFFTFWNVRE